MNWLRQLFAHRRIYGDLSDEIRAHLEEKVDELVAAGMPREEAKHAARREFGNVLLTEQTAREVWSWPALENFWMDVRYSLRMLRKSPGFTAVAVVTLALGIGANTAIFSAVNGILIEPLPYPDSARLLRIEAHATLPGGFPAVDLSLPEIRDIQHHCPALSQMAFYGAFGGRDIRGGAFPDRVLTALVSGNFFTMLGGQPLLGRPILPSDAEAGNNQIAVLSFGLWKDDFGGDPKVIGRTILLEKKPYTVIAVMPSRFGLGMFGRNRIVWVPLVPSAYLGTTRAAHRYFAIGRLRPGATLAAANAQLKALSARLAAAYPATDKGWHLSANSEKAEEIGPTLPAELLILLGAVGFVLLIACVNVSAMLLARCWTRHREIAIRVALGATRGQLVRQLLVESLMLSLAGGALGLLVAAWAIPALRAVAPPGTPRVDQLRLDANVFWFALCVSVLSGVTFGLMPAFAASSERVGASFKAGASGLLEGLSTRGPRRLRGALVVIEIALAVILATGASLVARSLQRMMAVPVGFRTEHMLVVGASLGGSACESKRPEPCYLAVEEIVRRLRALPGVEAATAEGGIPLNAGYGTFGIDIDVAGHAKPARAKRDIMFTWAMPGYFRVMGIPLLAGRDFTDSDTSSSPRVAIVNRAFARFFFPGENPLGRRISTAKDQNGHPQWMEIVGEAADVHDIGITAPPPIEFYMPETQSGEIGTFPTFLLRTAANPLALAGAVKQQITSVDKNAPIRDVETADQIVAAHEAEPRFRTALLATFGFLGLLLAAVGAYGVISYAVSRRTREIGLRMALGAQPGDALRMVIREGMVLATVGIVIGIAGALALTRLLRSYLFEITPTDPVTLASVSIALAVAALAACYFPARRAMRVDPMAALRNE